MSCVSCTEILGPLGGELQFVDGSADAVRHRRHLAVGVRDGRRSLRNRRVCRRPPTVDGSTIAADANCERKNQAEAMHLLVLNQTVTLAISPRKLNSCQAKGLPLSTSSASVVKDA